VKVAEQAFTTEKKGNVNKSRKIEIPDARKVKEALLS